MTRVLAFCVVVFVALFDRGACDLFAGPYELRSGDRVVLIGDGLIEQEQYFGWIEVMLTTSFPDRDVTFRNLGWSGDTPKGDSRNGLSLVQAGREPEGEAWRQLKAQLELTKPTVAVLGYGMANALEGASAKSFLGDVRELIAELKRITPECRFVILSPLMPFGDSVVTAKEIDAYAEGLESLSNEVDGRFVDLRDVAMEVEQRKDAVHLNGDGYRLLASEIQKQLELESGWSTSSQTEPLRQVVLEKNRWWFHRSRPANMAYVFGFRKREQGQNAVEIPQFDPLIEVEEKRIAALRALKPVQLQAEPPRLKSKYAEFTQQPRPDFVVADDLEVTLWAENPLLNKPIHMNFDAQGRLWIASSEAYPMIEVGQSLPDKIVVLADRDGDGKADESTVFADGLLIPTGVVPGDGGVYVAQSTDLLFLKDTDGDGKADKRERVLSGFGTEDTHHNLHTLLFGPDGRLYMNQSVYTRTDAETPFGVVRLKAGGGFRYDTRRRHMGVFFRGLWNPWGHQFDAYGNSFMTDGAGFAGMAYVFPGSTFNPTPNARRLLDLISPGKYPKFCGGEIVRGESFPDDWQDTFVTCDFRANRVTRFSLSESDAGFVTTQEADLIRTTQSSFRPIDVKQGPDGALYIADWSNPIINHGEVDFRDPRRDRWHGRIWRVAFKNRPHHKPIDLATLKIDELFDRLLSGDRYLSDQSRRVLIDRARETSRQIGELWTRAKTPLDQLHVVRLSAAVGKPNTDWLTNVVQSGDPRARAAAARIVADWSESSAPDRCLAHDVALRLLGRLVVDEFPRARLEAVRGLSRLGGLEAVRLSFAALKGDADRFIEHALFLNVEEHADELVADLTSAHWSDSARTKQMEFVLTSLEPSRASGFLAGYLEANGIAKDGAGPWIELIAKAGGPEQLGRLYEQLDRGGFDAAAAVRAIDALSTAAVSRKIRPDFGKQSPGKVLKRLLNNGDLAIRAAAIELTGAWKMRFLVPQLATIAGDDASTESLRAAAVRAMQRCGGDVAIQSLVELSSHSSEMVASEALVGLARLDRGQAMEPFFAALERLDEEPRLLALWRAMLGGKGAGKQLASMLPAEGVSKVAARAGIRAAKEPGRDAQSLIDALMPMSGLSIAASEWSPERAAEIRDLVAKSGDPSRGELVYRRADLQCATCHAIGGVGGKVGPDMTSLGASAPADYIIESLFDPNAKIKENYHTVNVLTDDGRVVSGIEIGRSDGVLRLRDATNKLIEIAEDEILETKAGKSLMPANLLDRIPQSEQLDLLSFLTQLGKPGEFDASKQDVARVLEVFAGTHRIEQAGNADILSGKRVEGWKPVQSRVSGKLYAKELYAATAQPFNISLVNLYLRTSFEVASDTDVRFTIDGAKAFKVWVDGQGAKSIGQSISVPAGKHTALFQIDARGLPEAITVRGEKVTFSTSE
ncbi:MAG: PVC-type heme-binding CxxCH protein [Planctomycetota bacterium]